jgi:Zn-dependent M16 (insulinase) family peptidase
VLLNSKIDDTTEMNNILSQAKSHMEDMIISSGESLALSRIQAGLNEAGAVSEYLAGYEAYRIISSIHKDKDAIAALTDEVAALLKKMVDRRRLTISLAGEVDDEVISKLISIFPTGANAPIRKTTPPCATRSEYFMVPSKVAYATLGGAKETVTKNLGRMRVARSILSYEYLWNTVRVQNGAYGTGFVPKSNGSLSFYSYRDPSPANSLGFYRESAKPYLYAGRMTASPEIECESQSFEIRDYGRSVTLPALLSSSWEASDGSRVLILVNPDENEAKCAVDGVELSVPPLDAIMMKL